MQSISGKKTVYVQQFTRIVMDACDHVRSIILLLCIGDAIHACCTNMAEVSEAEH